jgi:alpha-1,6-mannosyltransferase
VTPLLFDPEPQSGPGFDAEAHERTLWSGGEAGGHLVDTTMFFGARSGGIKRYLLAKSDWIRRHRLDLTHTIVVPGRVDRALGGGVVEVGSPPLPFSDGYRWPLGMKRWADTLVEVRPDLIEAGDAFMPGRAAQEAASRCGVPVVGFCHTDPAALATLHFGEWASAPAQARWGAIYNRFDLVVAPSRFIAGRLKDAGVSRVAVQPLGVDTDVFRPSAEARAGVRAELGLASDERLLVFAGRAAREKNVTLLVETLDRLGAPYRMLLIGAGAKLAPHPRIAPVDFETDQRRLVRWLAGADAFVHANDQEPFGLVALEALACGLPVVAPPTGGVAETVDETVGQRASASTPHAFAEAIEALFERDLEAIGRAARARAEALYGWNGVFPRLMALYGELCPDFHRAAPA